MDIRQLRVGALRRLIGADSLKDFAEEHDLDSSYLSQILNGHRNLGEKAARNMEEKIGCKPGTLVTPPPARPDEDTDQQKDLGTSAGNYKEPTNKTGSDRDSTAGTSYALPVAAQVIAKGFAEGKLTAADIEELRRMALHLIKKNAPAATAAPALPDHLDGLAEAALTAAENGENSEDLLKMVGHGLKKSQPKEGQKSDGKRKARSS